ncbi:DUF3558 domain-containing protein [Tomitella biformata]|uniref:DUF3558 domain-containing protein n=1 Tax=Tomitella biformata TaxID=630403 RepID=UPI00056FB203|nr:DUF3558 domain-containing protein [Tomitella biformata]
MRVGVGRGGFGAVLCGLVVAPVLLAGCGSGAGPGPAAAPAADAPMVAEPGPFLQMCGGVSDEEFLRLTTLPAGMSSFHNLVGCSWDDMAGGGHGSLSWYRGSPIEREHTIVDTTGRVVQAISIAGHDGYEGRTSDGTLCEVGISLGDDFYVWSLVLPPALGVDTCGVARQLATMTLERAQ